MQVTYHYSLLAAALITGSVQAETFRQHDAHQHGHVEFNIAQDGNELLVEIIAPGADVVGFEHPPENQTQHDRLKNAEALLKQADQLLQLNSAAQCQVKYTDVNHSLKADEHEHEHEHEHEQDMHEDHDQHNDHEQHEDHDQHQGHGHEQHEGHEHHTAGDHAEFNIEYHFVCDNLTKLTEIDTLWFKHFPTSERIEVNLLTDNAQLALELNKNNPSIRF